MSLPPLSPVIVIQCLAIDQGLITLGRSLLQSFVVDYVLTKHAQADLNSVLHSIISEPKLASISEDLKITQLKALPEIRDKANILLAFIGAIYKEMGFDKLKGWLYDVITPNITAIVESQGTAQPEMKPNVADLEAQAAEAAKSSQKEQNIAADSINTYYNNSTGEPDTSSEGVSHRGRNGSISRSEEFKTEALQKRGRKQTEKAETEQGHQTVHSEKHKNEVHLELETYKKQAEKAEWEYKQKIQQAEKAKADTLKKVDKYKRKYERADSEMQRQAMTYKEREEGLKKELKELREIGEAKMIMDKEDEAARKREAEELSRKRKREEEAGPPLKNLRWQSSHSIDAKTEFIEGLLNEGKFNPNRPMSRYDLDHGKLLPISDEMKTEVQPEFPSSYPPPLPALTEVSLFEVLTHRSLNPPLNVMQDPEGYTSFDNERLEFLGDAVLEVHTTEAIFVQHPQLRPGGMVSLRNRLVNGNILSYFAEMYGLPSKLRVSTQLKNQDSQVQHHSMKTKADAMEAYIGAVFRDREPGISRSWLIELLGPFVKCHLTAVQREFEERNRGEVQGHWSTAINKIFGNKLNWEFGETDRNLDGVASWFAILHMDGQKIAEASSSSKKNARFTIAAMMAEHLNVPDAAGNYIPEGFSENIKHGYLNKEALDGLKCVEELTDKK
ncbi:hypothetical protein E3P81_00223 [Wallemia ichthyophaga]|nr:hypothetical protein E3P97_00225 [Wallemia ichthyophaga]TIB35949.1 hypothetical protein E3P85_00246 [Wallemia ichthyophaga]TIB50982.1 hypothetical protein E3P82_00225 [Wallemia ichthyophaga]TIB54411.1 hypothetical protein E3P81_00223 [Wallemia ichthyophaga]TIB57024.1 hypothetical protein E3P80_00225 [Wallemia ichthyophaga]